MGQEVLIKCTMASSLAWSDTQEQAVDRVTAIAIASKHNELGSLMLRVEALDAPAYRKVILLVIRQLNHKHRITRGFAERMANAVLHEVLQPHCTSCGGRAELHDDGKTVLTCTHCGGSGLMRYSDHDRRSMIGTAYSQQAYDGALSFVRNAMRSVVSGASSRLTD